MTQNIEILESAIKAYNKKGLKFTMDDIAADIGISKKTIYTVFSGKDELLSKMVDYIFDGIRVAKSEALERDVDGDLRARIKAYLAAMPKGYEKINFAGLSDLKEKYPKLYRKVKSNLENNWEPAIELLEQGKREGVVRQDADLNIFRMMMESATTAFFERDTLKKAGLTYMQGLEQVVDILLGGICVR